MDSIKLITLTTIKLSFTLYFYASYQRMYTSYNVPPRGLYMLPFCMDSPKSKYQTSPYHSQQYFYTLQFFMASQKWIYSTSYFSIHQSFWILLFFMLSQKFTHSFSIIKIFTYFPFLYFFQNPHSLPPTFHLASLRILQLSMPSQNPNTAVLFPIT